MTTPWPAPIRLSDPRCALEPLAVDHHDGLVEAVEDGRLWELWYTNVPSPAGMRAEIERRLGLQAAGAMLPFTVRDAAGRIVGMSTYLNVDAGNRRVEIGATWTAASAQRTGLTRRKRMIAPTYRAGNPTTKHRRNPVKRIG